MSDKAEESALGPKSQVKRSGEPITPPPCKKGLGMPLLSVREEAEGSSQPEASAMSLEDGEDAHSPLPSPPLPDPGQPYLRLLHTSGLVQIKVAGFG